MRSTSRPVGPRHDRIRRHRALPRLLHAACRCPVSSFAAARLAEAIWAAPVAGSAVALIGGVVYRAGERPRPVPPGRRPLWRSPPRCLPPAACMRTGFPTPPTGLAAARRGSGSWRSCATAASAHSGPCALALSILLRWSALAESRPGPFAWCFCGLIAAHAASRALLPAFMHAVAAGARRWSFGRRGSRRRQRPPARRWRSARSSLAGAWAGRRASPRHPACRRFLRCSGHCA